MNPRNRQQGAFKKVSEQGRGRHVPLKRSATDKTRGRGRSIRERAQDSPERDRTAFDQCAGFVFGSVFQFIDWARPNSIYSTVPLTAMLLSLMAVDHWVNGAAAFKRDLPGQPFRRAPMAESSRSIVIPLATDLHLAFDAQLLLTHTVLSGPGLNLRGPPYTGAKSPFLCDFA